MGLLKDNATITPKPVALIERVLELGADENALILDSFAGSGTTAHAVLKANARDDGTRRFILVEGEAYADTLTAERVRRAINGYAWAGTQRESRIVRALLDVAPNAWCVWSWVDAVLQRLLRTWDASVLAASTASLIERLRIDLEAERDRLAHAVFERQVAQGRIEFRLRADCTDYELPHALMLELAGKPKKLTRTDEFSDIEKSLLAPALRTPDLNDFEAVFCGYLDEQQALRWWHRNVAKTQYGLQGWKRHKVYPDFVFGFLDDANAARVVLLETKGLHLGGSEDTQYKQALLARLTEAFCDERFRSVGELALEEGGRMTLNCDLVFDRDWRSVMDARYFDAASQVLSKR
jgi:type III restriction enzyme